jgi:shikimate 5-dehydrogenase
MTDLDAVQLPTAATAPTMYFIGVTTGKSSIRATFPRWAAQLRLADARLEGIDLPLHAPREAYRRVVSRIAADRLSRGALITTHKIDLYNACRDLFDEIDVADNAAAVGTSLSSDTLAGIDEALGEAVERDGSLVGSMLLKKRPT